MSEAAHELPTDEIEPETYLLPQSGSDTNSEATELAVLRQYMGEDFLASNLRVWLGEVIRKVGLSISDPRSPHHEKFARIRTFSIANGLPECPGERFRQDGPYSAEEFRDDYLEPALRNEQDYDAIVVNFDGVACVSREFVDETFAGLVRTHGMSLDFLARRLVLWTSKEDLRDAVSYAWKRIYLAFSVAAQNELGGY